MDNFEKIEHNGSLIALVLRKNFDRSGLTFVTKDDFGLQLGIHIQNKGFKVKPHRHLPFDELKNLRVQEIFYVETGKIRVKLYDDDGKKIKDIEGNAGDIIIANTGHDLLCLEDSKVIEIKQGPYRGKNEKRYFD